MEEFIKDAREDFKRNEYSPINKIRKVQHALIVGMANAFCEIGSAMTSADDLSKVIVELTKIENELAKKQEQGKV